MAGSKPPEATRNVITRWVGQTLVFVQNDKAPSELEWDEFLRILADNKAELPKLRLLVMTTGGAPTTAQRKRLAATLGGTPMRVSSVSDNMKIRFVAATISLFHSDHRLFSSTEISEAYDHLGLTPAERREIEIAINEMRPKVRLLKL